MRKSAREVVAKISGESEPAPDPEPSASAPFTLRLRKLPATAIVLIAFIAVVAMPLFFMLPRVGGAGLGKSEQPLDVDWFFRLGQARRHRYTAAERRRRDCVRLDGTAAPPGDLYFKGVALDTFDNKTWERSEKGQREPFVSGDRDFFQLDYASGKENLMMQTIYLEPLDTPVLFAVPKTVAVQGNFVSCIRTLTARSRSIRITSPAAIAYCPTRASRRSNGSGPTSKAIRTRCGIIFSCRQLSTAASPNWHPRSPPIRKAGMTRPSRSNRI